MFSSEKVILNSQDIAISEIYNKDSKQLLKNSKLIDHCGIEYSEGVVSSSYIEYMKQGYLAMKELNLELSEYGFESYIDDLKEYEASL